MLQDLRAFALRIRQMLTRSEPEPLARPPGPPTQLVRAGFQFSYPSDWAIDDADPDFDPDHLLVINASPGGMILFIVADLVMPLEPLLQDNVAGQAKQFTDVQQQPFTAWGSLSGLGMTIQGTAKGPLPTTVRIFVFHAAQRTFTMVEMAPDDERVELDAGFRMLEESFQVTVQ